MSFGTINSAYAPQVSEATYDAQATGQPSANGNTGYLGADAAAQSSAGSGSGTYGPSNGVAGQASSATPAGLTPGEIAGFAVGGVAFAAGTAGVLYGGLRKGGWWRPAAPAGASATPAAGSATTATAGNAQSTEAAEGKTAAQTGNTVTSGSGAQTNGAVKTDAANANGGLRAVK